jgi:hypothetical protein
MSRAKKSKRATAYKVTDEQREELVATLHGLGKFIERAGGERDMATAACLYALCLAIREEAEVELARHILMLDGDDDETADALLEADDMRGH